ncbi:MAG: hypothetical protein LCH56_06510 [Proteobacteria bacterium]|nr:hypothetical protein [Pseudomonadota bacterium]
MTEKRRMSLKQQVLQDIWAEMIYCEDQDLDGYLTGIGLDTAKLEAQYDASVQRAVAQERRVKFEAARKEVKTSAASPVFNVLLFDVSRKREVHATIKLRMANTGEMTLAARNQAIDAEQDLDNFLFMCFRLGVIDSDGNLKV